MATIPWPACAFITGIDWTLDQPAQVNKSQWTGKRQVTILPVAATWGAKVTFEVKGSEADSLDMQAFVVDLQGPANTTMLPGSAAPQFSNAITGQVDGNGQAGFSLNVRGLPSGLVLKRGHKFTINGQMAMIMAAATVGGDGRISLSLKPPIRAIPADGTAIEFTNPTARMALKDTSAGWTSDYAWNGQPDATYSFTLTFEEVI